MHSDLLIIRVVERILLWQVRLQRTYRPNLCEICLEFLTGEDNAFSRGSEVWICEISSGNLCSGDIVIDKASADRRWTRC